MLNIIENAANCTPAGGQIRFSARQETRQTVTLEVADTGVGIPSASLPYIFERFYRADPARARQTAQAGGAGLGLSIAKSLVEAQGGEISLTSKEGAGTVVQIRFPLVGSSPGSSAH